MMNVSAAVLAKANVLLALFPKVMANMLLMQTNASIAVHVQVLALLALLTLNNNELNTKKRLLIMTASFGYKKEF